MKLPPYGKPLHDLLASGFRPDNSIYLFIGAHAWDEGQKSSIVRPTRTLILPPFKNPIEYDWPVMGCDILMRDTGGCPTGYIEQTVFHLFEHQADIVRCIAPDFSYYATYKKDL